MSAWIGFLIGFAVGGSFAAVMLACLQAGRSEEEREDWYQGPAAQGNVEQSTAEQDASDQPKEEKPLD